MLLDFTKTRLEQVPAINYALREFAEVDDPDHIRWRARWDSLYDAATPIGGIWMECYPVVRKTRCGAWIDPLAYRQATRQPWEDGAPANEWVLSDKTTWRFVQDRSGAGWAKPTRAAALRSLGVRLIRWGANVRRDVERVNAACRVAEALLTAETWSNAPEHTIFWPGAPAKSHQIVLADEDTPLAIALRGLRAARFGGDAVRVDAAVAEVLAAWGAE